MSAWFVLCPIIMNASIIMHEYIHIWLFWYAVLVATLARHPDKWKTKDQNTTKYIMVPTGLYLGWTSRALTQATMVKISRCRSIEGNISIKPDCFMLCTPTFPAEFSKNMVIYDTTVDVLKILKIYGNLGIFGKFWKFWIFVIYSFEIWHIPSNTRRSASAREPAVSAPPPRPPLPPQWLELWCELGCFLLRWCFEEKTLMFLTMFDSIQNISFMHPKMLIAHPSPCPRSELGTERTILIHTVITKSTKKRLDNEISRKQRQFMLVRKAGAQQRLLDAWLRCLSLPALLR